MADSKTVYLRTVVALIIVLLLPVWTLYIANNYSPATLSSTLEKPAWLRVNRFSVTYPPETIVDVGSIDFKRYPRLREAFEVEEKSHLHFPHPYEWVNCTHREGLEIVELLGGRYVAGDEAFEDYVFAIRYQDINYFIVVAFSWKQPLIQ